MCNSRSRKPTCPRCAVAWCRAAIRTAVTIRRSRHSPGEVTLPQAGVCSRHAPDTRATPRAVSSPEHRRLSGRNPKHALRPANGREVLAGRNRTTGRGGAARHSGSYERHVTVGVKTRSIKRVPSSRDECGSRAGGDGPTRRRAVDEPDRGNPNALGHLRACLARPHLLTDRPASVADSMVCGGGHRVRPFAKNGRRDRLRLGAGVVMGEVDVAGAGAGEVGVEVVGRCGAREVEALVEVAAERRDFVVLFG